MLRFLVTLWLYSTAFATSLENRVISPGGVLTISIKLRHPSQLLKCDIKHGNSQQYCLITVPKWLKKIKWRYGTVGGVEKCIGFHQLKFQSTIRTVKTLNQEVEDTCTFTFQNVKPIYEGLWTATVMAKEGFRKLSNFNVTSASEI